MRPKSYFAVLGTVTALSFAIVAVPTYAADATSEKTLGQLERANKLIGKTVYSSDNQKLGKIDNFVVDLESGRVIYAVVGTGVFGVGGKDYAVAPGIFTDVRGDTIHINLDKQKFTGAPEFTKDIDKPEQLGQSTFANQVYQYFGQTAWWQGSQPADTGSFHNVHKAKDLIGMKVKNVANEDLGKVDNLMVDLPAGRVVFAILNPDSGLNLGNNYYALPPNALTLSSDQKNLVSDVNKDKLASAPRFTKDQWQNLSDPSFASKVYQYFGQQTYFETGGVLRPTGRTDDKTTLSEEAKPAVSVQQTRFARVSEGTVKRVGQARQSAIS